MKLKKSQIWRLLFYNWTGLCRNAVQHLSRDCFPGLLVFSWRRIGISFGTLFLFVEGFLIWPFLVTHPIVCFDWIANGIKPEIISIPREEEWLCWPPLRWWQSWFLPLDWWSIFIINLLNHLHSLKGERDTQWSPWMGYCQRVGGGGDLHRMRYFWPLN